MTTHHRLAALYDTHHERVFRFCLRLCSGHQEDAEDLTQEVFLAALGSLPRFAGRSRVQTWLFRIAVFRSRERRRQPVRLPLHEGDQSVEGHEAASVRMIALQCALATLPDPLREAFVLVKCEQLTHKEAAAVLELPQGTVQSRVFELVAAGIVATSFLLRPKPAYADIEKAMAAVQTAQWQVELTQWSDSGPKREVTECVASRALPAIATRERGGAGYFSLLTPTLSLSYERTRDVYLKETPIPAEGIRKHIQESFFPPSSRASGSVPSSPYRWTPWQVVDAKLEGKPVLRFHQECHYKSESYSTTLWADPQSRRLLRRESEMAWRGYRSKTVASQFRYDQPLPADAFALTVAKGKRVFVNDHHFYPGVHTVTPKELELVQLYNLLHWLDSGWATRRPDVFAKAFDFSYLPTLYNGIISPSPQKRAAQQESFWRNRLAQAAKARPRWDKWVSRVVSVEEQPSVRILGMTPFCLPEGDPPIWKVSVAVVCEAHQGKFPVYDGTTGYTLWVRRKGGTFRVIYAELDERFGEESHSPQRLFD